VIVEDAELVGGVLVGVPDSQAGARTLAQLLGTPKLDRRAATAAGFDADLVEVLRGRFGGDGARIELVCQLGAAWVDGRRSVAHAEPWDIVASLPTGTPLPAGLRRGTGETLMQLVSQSSKTLRLAAPFIDWPGISFLADALAAATARGVTLQVLLPTRSTHAGDALDELVATITRDGAIANYSAARLRFDAPWAHLKVLSSDSIAAYIGSANVTGAGIAGPNLELGVLVRGPAVAVVERVLDLYQEQQPR
jgi:phosphatidylserine/phosphatidylglycerophosphate/cardiolipin synthase-like enzyme